MVHFLAYRSFFFLAMFVIKEVPFTDDFVPDILFQIFSASLKRSEQFGEVVLFAVQNTTDLNMVLLKW